MTDELTTDLAQFGSLRVISRTSAMHYKGASKIAPEIGRELGVDTLIEGPCNASEAGFGFAAAYVGPADTYSILGSDVFTCSRGKCQSPRRSW
jgi:TolB-like protein